MLWTTRGALALLIFVTSCASGVFDPTGEKYTLELSQRKYTNLVRWGEIEMASAYVDPELQEEFLALAEDFEGIRITDYDSGTPNYPEEDVATFDVTYHAYSIHTFLEKKIKTNQEWYRDREFKDAWRVRPQIERIVAEVNDGLR